MLTGSDGAFLYNINFLCSWLSWLQVIGPSKCLHAALHLSCFILPGMKWLYQKRTPVVSLTYEETK